MSARTRTWRPLSELPEKPCYVLIREPDGEDVPWRWHPFREGSGTPSSGGRWQRATEYGFRNAKLPKAGAWREA